MKAPFPYFGGKSRVADTVWQRFGNVVNYVEPFCGSAAVLLDRPDGWTGSETINDYDGFVCNFWRALQADPENTTRWADWPVSELDLQARHEWLKARRETLTASLQADPEYFDAKIAGWWVWGLSSWIGAGWCFVRSEQMPHLGDAGQGVHRASVHLPHLGNAGRGVHRASVHLPHLGNAGQGLYDYLQELSGRLRRVRIACGDWTRVCGPSVTIKHGLTGVFLDPPYDTKRSKTYACETEVSTAVREWAIRNGDDPLLRIALCGYADEHGDKMPDNWTEFAWKAAGGYGSQGDGQGRENCAKETIWFSPHCLTSQPSLFDEALL